ncbi:MAG: hypothetical protein JNN17_02840 [Verrucomicrobiaceae bacterium]|nr:hypothetical protein [Verrucomicrobiaceae bacterium]
MKTRSLLVLLLVFVSITVPCRAQFPKLLDDWQSWVLWDETKHGGKPTAFDDKTKLMPQWYSTVEIKADAAGGGFRFAVDSCSHEWLPLPGDSSCWPQEVKIDGEKVPVLNREGVPCVELNTDSKGMIEGTFRWSTMPQSVRIPPQIGVLSLQLNGQPVELPVWDAEGRLWLQRTGTEPADKDFLAVKVYRLISDGSPQWLHTQVELSVAGKSREEALGHLLPDGWRLSSVETPVPCAVDDAGKLKAQVRAGKWTLKFAAYRTSPATTIVYAKDAKPLAEEELVGLQHDPAFRLVEISGIPAVDVAQTTYPDAWRQHPVHQWNPTQAFQIEEKMRGMGARKPQGITIRRSFWLDEDGKNMTYQDDLSGSGQQTWRLDAAEGHKLGAVKIGGAGQLITKNPANGSEGVEVRDRQLNLQAVGRLERGARLAATGWQHDAESLESRMNLPPGWRLLAVFGADWSRGDWLTSWSLFDVFLLLIVTLAVWKAWGWKTALIGLLGLLLAYHETGAPRFTWIILVAVFAAAKWVPENAPSLVQRLVNGLKIATLVLFALNAVPFVTQQIQQAIYPQLEPYRTTWQQEIRGNMQWAEAPASPAPVTQEADGIRERVAGAMNSLDLSSSRLEQKPSKFDLKSNLLYDNKAKIQTGPAVPQWKWREISFGWRGPVSADEKISLLLIPCGLERVITLLRIASMLGLVWLLLGKGKELPKWPGGKGRDGSSPRDSVLECAGPPALSSVARPAESSRGLEHSKTLPRPLDAPSASLLLATALIFFVLANTGSAQIPSPEMLNELRERVLSLRPQDPQRSEIPHVRLKLQGHRLEMEVEIHASEIVAVPLPGKLPSWSPLTVGDAVTLRHEGYLWVLAAPGVQTVKLTGLIPPGAEWQWSFLLKPRQVQIDAAGWTVTGMKPNGVPEDQVFFVEQNRSASAEAAYDQKDFFPVVRIERELELGLTWQVRTKVKRLSPTGKAISLSVPLLAAERVMSANMNASNGRIEVRFGAGDEEVTWESELAPVPDLTLKAEASENWVERWMLTASPVWNVHHEGLAPVYETSQAQLVPVWTPWPGESVKLTVSRPEAVQGATTTIHQARQITRLGDRQHSTQLTMQVQASLGEDFRLELPAEASISALRVRGQELPVRREGNSVILPVRPGDQEVFIDWKTPGALAFKMPTDAVTLPVMASNITTTVHMPASRWLLWASGPMRGPAVRFWGLSLAAMLLGFILAKIQLSPLKGYEWALLMLGFMQLPLFIGAAVVLWFFVIAWRGSAPSAIKPAGFFNVMQIILAGASLIALLCMLAVVHQGLLGRPEMFVTGYGSTTDMLQWFQDRTADGSLPRPVVISVSIWVYRALMLAWALWLASRVLRWLPWAAKQLSAGQIWKRGETKRRAATPPPLP